VTNGLALVESWRGAAALILTLEDGQHRTFTSRRFEKVRQVQ
jgi:hypothetical protein